jgi:hypothetical protein
MKTYIVLWHEGIATGPDATVVNAHDENELLDKLDSIGAPFYAKIVQMSSPDFLFNSKINGHRIVADQDQDPGYGKSKPFFFSKKIRERPIAKFPHGHGVPPDIAPPSPGCAGYIPSSGPGG